VYTALNCLLMLLMSIPTLNLLPTPILNAVLFMRELRAKELAECDLALQLCTE